MTKSLRSATTTIDVSSAPSSGQVLTASNSTTASWQSITTSLISDYTITDLKTNDMLLYNGTKWANNSPIYASLTLLQSGYFQLSLPALMDNTNTLLISYDESNNQPAAPIFYTTEVTGLTNITPNGNDVHMNNQAWSW